MLIDFAFADGSTDQVEGYSQSEYGDCSVEAEHSRAEIFGLIEHACARESLINDLLDGEVSQWSDVNNPSRAAYFQNLEAMKRSGGSFQIYDSESDDWTKEQGQEPSGLIDFEFHQYPGEITPSQGWKAGLVAAIARPDIEQFSSGILSLHGIPRLKPSTALLQVLSRSEDNHRIMPCFDSVELLPSAYLRNVEMSGHAPSFPLPVWKKFSGVKPQGVFLGSFSGGSEEGIRADRNKPAEVRFGSNDGYESSH